MSAYKEVAGLKAGDKVRVVQPWNDGKVVGGRTSRGRVTKRWDTPVLIIVAYKKHPKGETMTDGFSLSGSSGPYAYIVPVDRDLDDDGVLVPVGTVHGSAASVVAAAAHSCAVRTHARDPGSGQPASAAWTAGASDPEEWQACTLGESRA